MTRRRPNRARRLLVGHSRDAIFGGGSAGAGHGIDFSVSQFLHFWSPNSADPVIHDWKNLKPQD